MKLIVHWIISAVAIMITAYLLPKTAIFINSFYAALVVAVVLGFLNTIFKPILVLLTLPINILTLGLFTLVINAVLVMLTASVVPGFEVKSFWWALIFSVVLSIIGAVLHMFEPHSAHHTAQE